MRITFNMQAMQYQQYIENGLNASTQAGLRVVNKRNLLSPEQNPSQYVGAYNIQRMIDELTQFTNNANNASSWLKNTDKEVTSIIELLKKAKSDLAIGGTSSESDADSRKALAGQAAQLYNSLMDIANSSYLGRYIFGGHQTQNKPFPDGVNQVTGVTSTIGNGGEVDVKAVFGDLPELANGKYKAQVSVSNGIATLKVLDEKGNPVILDSNGSDQSGTKGNNSVTELTFEYKPGAVINTGRGISIKMPDSPQSAVELSFNYKAGSEVNYMGDSGSIFSQIGYNQDIAMNITGNNIFTQTYKTLQGSRFNTVGGMAATLSTYFSSLDKANSSIGDSITISGTDHNGNKVGAATIISPLNPKLDLTNASEKERTLTVGYGDKLYKVVVPQGAYKSPEDLTGAINNQLKTAEYVGSLGDIPAGMSVETYKNFVQGKIDSGDFEGEKAEADKQKFYTDLSGQVSAFADGDRISFVTTKAGDNVRLTVSGGAQNVLGFKGMTAASLGKDTSFEIGYDPHKSGINQLQTTHNGMMLFPGGGSQSFVINGKLINVPIPAGNITTTNETLVDLNGANDYVVNAKGKEIRVTAAELAAAPTAADKQALINQKISDAGLGSEVQITVTDDGLGTFNVDTSVSDLSKKDYEQAFDKALRASGFDFGMNVSLTPSAGGIGSFDVTFNMVNNNVDKNTALTTTYMDMAAVPPIRDMQTDAPVRPSNASNKEKTLGDLVEFAKNLYGDSAEVTLSNGKLTVRDIRSGESKLSMNIKGSNEGISSSLDSMKMGGKFTGSYDDKWDISVTGTLNADGTKDMQIAITDKFGNKIYDRVASNYLGGEIELPYGVKINPAALELDAANPTRTTAFSVDLKSRGALGFGDMNVIENGDNVNIFKSLKNLEHALLYNITKNGFAEPSAWKDSSLKSSAKPFLDGTFQGTFNDNWNYEVMQSGGKKDFYIQNEYKDATGDIRFDPAMTGLGNELAFGVDYYDNVTGVRETLNVSIDITKAVPPVTDAKSMQDYIKKTLNDDQRFIDRGVKFTSKDGKIQLESGSGTKVVNFTNNGTGAAKVLTSFVMGFETVANNKVSFPVTSVGEIIDVNDPHDPVPGLPAKTIIVPPGTYNTEADLLAAINGELNITTAGRVQASFDDKGALVFKTTGDVPVATSTAGGANPLGLGLTGGIDSEIVGTGVQAPTTNLTEATEAQRTLTFKYMAGVPPVQQTTSIMLDKKEYASPAALAAAVNEKLAAAGIAEDDMKAVINSKGEMAFAKATTNFSGVTVEGDHSGFLGFPKAGDEAKVKVTDANGKVVQEVTVSSANQSVYVSDGLHLGFNAGSLNATDSFSAGVGSGIENEIPILDAALQQVLEASSIVGNRGSRVETVISFNGTVIKSNEAIKAGYLGSTEMDQIKAQTDWTLAQGAYQTALTVVGKSMSISLLDFLR